MSDHNRIPINSRLSIPLAEIRYTATRSGGPGGQHANTSATRVELTWNPRESPSLSQRRRDLILDRLQNRIDDAGNLRLVCDTHRSQHRNKQDVTDRFATLIADALRPRKKRRPTSPTRAAKEKRLQNKKQRGRTKKLRGPVRPDE